MREQIVDLIAEELGLLAEVVVDEVLDLLGIEATDLSRHYAGKFVRVLNHALPADMDNRQIVVREVGKLLLSLR